MYLCEGSIPDLAAVVIQQAEVLPAAALGAEAQEPQAAPDAGGQDEAVEGGLEV